MTLIGVVSFALGVAFLMIGAWPVLGFFGLDVALIYWAFKLNYRSGSAYETVSVAPDVLTLTRVHPSGRREDHEFNPYWARVKLTTDRPDGRTSLRLAAQGREVLFGQFLTDGERREFADALAGALTHRARRPAHLISPLNPRRAPSSAQRCDRSISASGTARARP